MSWQVSAPKPALVEFKDVGRNKLSWTERIADFSWDGVVGAIKRKGALRSRDIDIDFGDEDADGWMPIFAGMHRVGFVRRAVRAAPEAMP